MRIVLMMIAGTLFAGLAAPTALAQGCPAQGSHFDLGAPLPRSRAAVRDQKELEIVALGSSSTAGYGATSPRRSYPAEMLRVLQREFPGVKLRVVNRGIGGQEVNEMLERLDRDVIKEDPDLVIWQLGTNAALRARNVDEFRRLLSGGVDRLKARGFDVVLMNLQFAPAVVALPNEEAYLDAIREVAKEKGIGLFQRWEIMRYWFEHERMAYGEFINPDGLHLNDYGYRCIGTLIGEAIRLAIQK